MKIYATYKNSDMTEGRGPMVMDKVFLHKDHANNYIDGKPGIMGRTAKWSQEKHGDWKVEEINVYEYDVQEQEEKNKKDLQVVLSSLTTREYDLLEQHFKRK